ncbi:MAG: Vms1/Ankzf1 family peptidyl-tRNA hydrolase [Chloroflexi bacterium]|nr:Vms1/Ankzf1 family peptidyl-tRNA hydrolase [Chloroflexota bacterium]
MPVVNQSNLTRARALRWLSLRYKDNVAFSLYIRPLTGRAEIEKLLAQVLDRGEMLDALAEKAAKSPTGSIIFYLMDGGCVVRPPFPLAETVLYRGYEPGPLRSILEKDWKLGLILIRLGQWAIGIFEGEKLLEGKAGTGLVHARHHKGGSSANRFARHREKQMEYFFTRIEGHARELLEPRSKSLDYIIYGGARDTLLRMQKQCRFFGLLEGKVVDRLLSVRDPKRSAFEQAVGQAYASEFYEFKRA